MLQEKNDRGMFYQAEDMGTTIMAIEYDGGVVVAADTRTSYGGMYVADRVADKIDFVHDYIVACRSGAAGQSQNAVHKLRFLVESASIEQNKLPMVRTAARMLSKMNYEKQLETAYLLAGWDPTEGASVYMVNLGGACLKRKWGMGGSGSTFIYGYLDANYRQNLTEQEATQLCLNAVSLAMKRDGSSGGAIRLAVINQHGVRKTYYPYETIPYKSA